MESLSFPKTVSELQNADFETLHLMWKYASDNHCGKDSSSKGGKIFKEELGTDFTYSDLNKALSNISTRFDGWLPKDKNVSSENFETPPKEMLISRKNLPDTKRLQHKISSDTFEKLSIFLSGIPKHDVPKVLGQVIEKGLDYYQDCRISYKAEEKELIK